MTTSIQAGAAAARKPLKILHIITRLIAGGAQQNTVMSCAAQVAAGHQVHLAYGPIYGPEGSLFEEAKSGGANMIEVASMRRSILPGHDWFCYRDLRRIIREIRPDVVHTHSSKAGILGRVAAWREQVPAVIHTVHGSPFHDKQPWLVRKAYIAAERWAAKRCHKLIGITQPMVDLYREHHIGEPSQYTIIPSGVDVAFWSEMNSGETTSNLRHSVRQSLQDELCIPMSAPVIGLVARLDRLKGHEDLLCLMPQLRALHPELRLLFVGDGFHRPAIESLIRELHLEDRVAITGFVSFARVAQLYRAMDVMVLPSYQEGQSRTLIESLLAGCPIVAYDTGGIREVCIEGVTGRLVPTADKPALLNALAWTLENPAQAKQLAAQGKTHVMQKFDHRQMCQQIESLYFDVLNRANTTAQRAATVRERDQLI